MERRRQRMAWAGGGALAVVVAATLAAAPAIPGDGAAERGGVERRVADAGVAAPAEADRVETAAVAVQRADDNARPAAAADVAAASASGPAGGRAAGAVLETQVGSASYYANMLAGRPTASGVPYDPSAAVAAHRELPFGTRLRVHNLANGRAVEVVVVDRGPFAKGRILDLSRSAAEALDFIRAGHTRVRIEVLEYGG